MSQIGNQWHETENGLRLQYQVTPEVGQPALLFVHGLGANLEQFREQAAYFSDRYRVLRLSLRGHGESDPAQRADTAAYAMSTLMVDVIGLLDALEIDRVHWVGNSMGGLVGYECLRHHPERLHTLTTFGTTAELHRGGLTSNFITGLMRLVGPRGMGWMTERTASHKRKVAERVGQMMRQSHRDALRFCILNLADYDYRAVLEEHSEVPILLMQGEHDLDINEELGSTYEALNTHGHSEIVDLPHCGHFANLEHTNQFNRVLEDFLHREGERA